MKWYKSLVFKIILCCIVLIFCLVGSVFGVLYRYQQSILSEMEEKSSEILRGIVVKLTDMQVDETPKDILESRLSDLKAQHGVDGIILYDSERKIVSSVQSEDLPLLEFGTPNKARVVELMPAGGKKRVVYFQNFPLIVGTKQVGSVQILLALEPQTHLVKALQSKVLVALVVLFLGTIVALCFFIFNLLHPLHTMAVTCHEISEGNLHKIDIKPNANEVLVLEMKYNEMVEALRSKARMEQKLVQAERLSALGNLAAGVAHEIGNPLNGIKLTISHLKDIFSQRELDESSFNRYADTIISEVNRLDAIVKDFLTLAKERELSLQRCSVEKLVKETIRLIEKDAQRRNVSIKAHIPRFEEESLVDPQLLKSAILNVLINAMEASGKSGAIDVSMEKRNGCFVLQIKDQGEGIPQEVIDRVFDPYFSTKSSGTGLGLSLTKTIIEKHGGEIALESKLGKGTSVTVIIPVEGT
ncbi:MAG: GHKL domain-containing protein [Candidatus Lindowbacteria bacterium]|nr:GHKL domain-containing protein [Candidatus Lindowbacteria bacterium]